MLLREKRKSRTAERTSSRSIAAASIMLLMLESPCTNPLGIPDTIRSFKYTRPITRSPRFTQKTQGRHLPRCTVAQKSSGGSELESPRECCLIRSCACASELTRKVSRGVATQDTERELAFDISGKPRKPGRRIFKDGPLIENMSNTLLPAVWRRLC